MPTRFDEIAYDDGRDPNASPFDEKDLFDHVEDDDSLSGELAFGEGR